MTHINSSVASTISNMVDFGGNTHEALIALCAALFSIVVYSVGASYFGIPTSESHSLIAGLTGAAIALHNGLSGVNGAEWVKVLYGLVMSLLLGFGTGWLICKALTVVCAALDRRKANIFFRYAQIFGAAHELHARRAGRAEVHRRAVLGLAFCNGQTSVSGVVIPVWLMLLCSTVMGVGTSVGAKRSSNRSAWTWSGWKNTRALRLTFRPPPAC